MNVTTMTTNGNKDLHSLRLTDTSKSLTKIVVSVALLTAILFAFQTLLVLDHHKTGRITVGRMNILTENSRPSTNRSVRIGRVLVPESHLQIVSPK
jgi:hypothetical protein